MSKNIVLSGDAFTCRVSPLQNPSLIKEYFFDKLKGARSCALYIYIRVLVILKTEVSLSVGTAENSGRRRIPAVEDGLYHALCCLRFSLDKIIKE